MAPPLCLPSLTTLLRRAHKIEKKVSLAGGPTPCRGHRRACGRLRESDEIEEKLKQVTEALHQSLRGCHPRIDSGFRAGTGAARTTYASTDFWAVGGVLSDLISTARGHLRVVQMETSSTHAMTMQNCSTLHQRRWLRKAS